MIKLDYEILSVLNELLCVLVEEWKLKEDFNVSECAKIVFSIIATSLFSFVYDDTSNIEEVKKMIKKQIDFAVR
ncbi:MAG: hypothetical protein ACLKAK_10260 [Alkaliphilus sp.]